MVIFYGNADDALRESIPLRHTFGLPFGLYYMEKMS